MKSRIKLPSGFLFFPLLCLLFSGCQNYYRISRNNYQNHIEKTIDSLITKNKYFILRTSNKAWHLEHPVLDSGKTLLSGTLDTLPTEHTIYVNGQKRKMRYSYTQTSILEEVHIFIPDSIAIARATYSLPLSQIQKIEIIEKNRKKQPIAMWPVVRSLYWQHHLLFLLQQVAPVLFLIGLLKEINQLQLL